MTLAKRLVIGLMLVANLGVFSLLGVLVVNSDWPGLPVVPTGAPAVVQQPPGNTNSSVAAPAGVTPQTLLAMPSATPAALPNATPGAPASSPRHPPSALPPVDASDAAQSDLPASASLEGITGRRQALPLSCESRSAADWAAFFGVVIDELEFLAQLPQSDDPDRGFVGDVTGDWGNIPPQPYGVHAGPVARLLRDYGLRAEARRHVSWDRVRAELASGRPVIVWVVGHVEPGEASIHTASDGRRSVVAAYEHTVIVIGYTEDSVTVLDGSRRYTRSLESFLDSWGVLRNMAIMARG